MRTGIESILVHDDTPLKEVMVRIDRGAEGIALIVDGDQRLVATVTDGDVRRGVLAGLRLDDPVHRLPASDADPVTAPATTDREQLLVLMKNRSIRQIPLLDGAGRPVDLATLDDLVSTTPVPLQAVVMAGGFGSRLAPLTQHTPKPMLPVGDRPMLHHIVEQLEQAGVPRVFITTHYLPEVIESYFGDGEGFGVDIEYVREDKPLGTAGALGLLDPPEAPLLVVNGDVLTDINYQAMLDFHLEHNADLTVASRSYDIEVPFGILDCQGPLVRGVREKPKQRFFISAGIYLLSPSAHADIPTGCRVDMPDLIERVIERGGTVAGFPLVEYWLDVGQHPQYQQAQSDLRDGAIHSAVRTSA